MLFCNLRIERPSYYKFLMHHPLAKFRPNWSRFTWKCLPDSLQYRPEAYS